jgi:uncharacterized phage protein (TIGR01671 family)
MREIKFRAWNAVIKRMFTAEEMAEDQMTLLPTGLFINVDGKSTKLSVIYSIDEMLPLQFTGLKDKNGKEIYERDVIEYRKLFIYGTEEGILKRVTVEWSEYQLGYRTDGHNLKDIVDGKMLDIGGGSMGCKIIGNIYENPELISQGEQRV